MEMPAPFPLEGESAIASYDYHDLAEGTGIKMFYGMITENGTASYAVLSDQALYSNYIENKWAQPDSQTYTLRLERDFDLSAFNLPKVIKGTGLIQHGVGGDMQAGSEGYFYIIYKLRKYSGTESEIASATSPIITVTDAGAQKIFMLPITIPQTHFKKGDILRLTVECWSKSKESPHAGNFAIGNDPINRDGTYIKPSTDTPVSLTKLQIYIPFKVNL